MYAYNINKSSRLPSNNAVQLSFYSLGKMRNIILRSTKLKFPLQTPADEAIVMAKLLDIHNSNLL
jgi:hypothetical protein